jgi:hypothetical protein
MLGAEGGAVVPTRESVRGFRGTSYRGVRSRLSSTDGRNVDDGGDSTTVPKRPA